MAKSLSVRACDLEFGYRITPVRPSPPVLPQIDTKDVLVSGCARNSSDIPLLLAWSAWFAEFWHPSAACLSRANPQSNPSTPQAAGRRSRRDLLLMGLLTFCLPVI